MISSRFSFLLVAFFLISLFSTTPVSRVLAANSNLRIYTTHDGLAGDFVTAIAFEPNGSAWIGTTQGVTHISNNGWVSYTRAHGLGDSWVTAIAVAPNGQIWFGTQSGGIASFDPAAKTFKTHTIDNSALPSNFITALAADSQNRLWVGTLNRGIAQFDPAKQKWTSYELPNNSVTALALDQDEMPWAGTDGGGVFHFDGSKWQRDENVGPARVKRIDAFDGKWYLTTDDSRFVLVNDNWKANDGGDEITSSLDFAGLTDGQITAFGKDYQQRIWLGTPRGIWMVHQGNAPAPPHSLPVVLVHGWTTAASDTLEDSEFRFLKQYADQDGIPMYYAQGISPKNTLFQNAAALRAEIERVKKQTGADKVNLIAFSMGGLNTRALLESSLYENDVNRAIILGTPEAGVDIWKPILAEQITQKPDEPSAFELTPEYAQLMNQSQTPRSSVPYDLLVGDARNQDDLKFLTDFPASDALISVDSALALPGANVRYNTNSDLHAYNPEALPVNLNSYLYPRDTYDRYLRNALRDPTNAPIGSEIASTPPFVNSSRAPANSLAGKDTLNHTPLVTGEMNAGETLTRTVTIDKNTSARFVAYFPGGDIDFDLIAPDGTRYTSGDTPVSSDNGALHLKADIASFNGYNIKNAAAGEWKLALTRTDNGADPLNVSTFAALDGARGIKMHPINEASVNQPLEIRVSADAPPPEMSVTARIAVPSATPGGAFSFVELPLIKKQEDYVADFVPPHGGWYLVTVNGIGTDYARGTEEVFFVNPKDAQLNSDATVAVEKGQVTFSVGINAARAGDYAVSARLVGKDNQNIQTVTPVTLQSGNNLVPLSFATKELAPGAQPLDLILLDANWTAGKLDERSIPVTIPAQ